MSSSTALLGLYSQHWLSFLPLMSVAAAYGSLTIASGTRGAHARIKGVVYATLILLVFTELAATSVARTPFVEMESLTMQKRSVEYILDAADREEPVLYLKNNCGGYVFNEDLHYYWVANRGSGYGRIFSMLQGYDVFGQSLVAKLEKENTRYIVSDEDLPALSPEARRYVTENYDYMDCLWVRRQGTRPAR